MHAPHIHYANSGIYLWLLGGKAHLVYIWFLAGPGRCQKTHMGPTWGPHVLVYMWVLGGNANMGILWATCAPYTCGWVLGGKAHLVYIWFSAGRRQYSTCDFDHQTPTWGPYGAYMCWYLWVLDGKAHLVYIWFLYGPRGLRIPVGSWWEGPSGIHLVFSWVKTMFDVRFLPPKTHMGPIWGPYVLVLVGSWWEGPSGIGLHLVFSWAQTMSDVRFSPPKTHMGRTWGPYAWVLGGKAHLVYIWFLYGPRGFSQPIQNPDSGGSLLVRSSYITITLLLIKLQGPYEEQQSC